MTIQIEVSPLTATYALTCPACSKPVLLAHRDDFELPNQEPWLTDGDCVPGVFEALGDSQKTPASFDYQLLIGHCPQCCASYYVVQAAFGIFSNPDAEWYLKTVAYDGDPAAGVRVSICTVPAATGAIPSKWIMTEYDTLHGLIQQHTFGPWRLDDPDSVSGPWGVAMCQGSFDEDAPWLRSKKLLLTMWDSMRDLHPALRESLVSSGNFESTLQRKTKMNVKRKIRFAIGVPALVAIAVIAIITCDRIAIAETPVTPTAANFATADVYAAWELPPKAVAWMETPTHVGVVADASYAEVQARSTPDNSGNVVLALARCQGEKPEVCRDAVLLTQAAATAPKLGDHALLLRTPSGGAVAVAVNLAGGPAGK